MTTICDAIKSASETEEVAMEKVAAPTQPKPMVLLDDMHRHDLLLEYTRRCDLCNYRDQDVDSYPCDKCHTRH